MYKSNRKDLINRQRMRLNYYGRSHKLGGKVEGKNLLKKVLKQILISILIVSFIILIKAINTPVTNNVSEVVKNAIINEFNYKNSLNKVSEYALSIKNGTKELTKSIPVFQEQSSNYAFELPLQGVVVSTYGEKYDPVTEKATFQRGIDIQGMSDAEVVKTIEDGIVETIGESESLGKFIKVRHNSNMFTLYSNLNGIYVQKNQELKKGDEIGSLGESTNSVLHFELWIKDEAVNPQLYLEYDYTNI